MEKEKYLGKITKATFGLGGYEDSTMGLHVTLKFGVYGCEHSSSYFDFNKVEHTSMCKWSEQDREYALLGHLKYYSGILHKAKKKNCSELVGTPVEVEMDGNKLKSWRILEEVL